MDDRNLMNIYPNGYKREHSWNLKQVFNINPNGVDYHNPNNVAIEFKETFAKKEEYKWFKIPKKQVDVTDVFVFCVKENKYFVVDKEDILADHSFKTYGERANMRLGKVKSLALFETDDIGVLKTFLDNLEL